MLRVKRSVTSSHGEQVNLTTAQMLAEQKAEQAKRRRMAEQNETQPIEQQQQQEQQQQPQQQPKAGSEEINLEEENALLPTPQGKEKEVKNAESIDLDESSEDGISSFWTFPPFFFIPSCFSS